MNREESARVLSSMRDTLKKVYLVAIDEERVSALEFAVGYLLAEDNNVPTRQPDPITGLVPCGCGGKAVDNEGIDYGYGYKCQKCGIATMAGSNRDCAKEDWNTAMGWKGGAE
jgi:hypothetical protein